MDKQTQAKIDQLSMIEQNLQNFAVQRQQYQTQLLESESAIKELEATTEAYKIVGNIMIKTDKVQLKKELDERIQMLNLRIESFEKQEAKLKEKAQDLQKQVLGELEKGEDDVKR